MHQDEWTPCPECGDEERPDEECWQCRGSGLMDPDGVVARMEESAKSIKAGLCPRCNKSAKRRNDGAVFCPRCGSFTYSFDEADVLRDPSILET